MISWKGTGSLHVVKGTVQKEQYITSSGNRFFQKIEEWLPENNGIFYAGWSPMSYCQICD
jgi:hypothetical protein